MENEYDPVVGNWYRRIDTDDEFQVIAFEEGDGVVEIQYFDGDVGEFDLETWHQLEIEIMEPPLDWSGPMDPDEAYAYGGGGETPEESEAASSINDEVTTRTSDQGEESRR